MNCSNCLNVQYDLLKGLYYDYMDETEDYVLCFSNIMNDYFWNLAYLKNETNNEIISLLENKFKEKKCIPCFYIGRDDRCYEYNKQFLISCGYKLNDTDVYMSLDNFKPTNINMRIKVVETQEEYEDYMKVLASAYNDNIENIDENVYADAINECYYEAIKKSIGNGKTYHIIGYNEDNIPVSVATLNISNGIGGINNVGTMQGYWNRGYGKQIISYLVNFFKEKGGQDLMLCTEYHTKNQSYYEKLGFKEIYVMEQYIK